MKKNNQWYSTLLALLLVGFMLVLTTGVLGLVLSEYNDTKWMEKYLKSYASAESWVELALLEIKDWVQKNTVNSSNPKAKIVGEQNLITYAYDGLTFDTGDVTIEWWEYDLIPLFYIEWGIEKQTRNIRLTWSVTNLHWNIISNNKWISGKGWIWVSTVWSLKFLNWDKFWFQETNVQDFVNDNNKSFIRIYNPNNSAVTYKFSTSTPEDKFVRNNFEIYSNWNVIWGWKSFKQNLKVDFEKSKYTNLLKYSIYKND